MSHGDSVTTAPAGFTSTAKTHDTPIVAFENSDAKFAGVQFHPEVLHSENGQEILRRWLIDVVGCKPTWNSENIVSSEVEKIKALVGSGRVLCGLSGGVDSAVAAAIVQKAVGSQLTCVFVDHGLLREGEAWPPPGGLPPATARTSAAAATMDCLLWKYMERAGAREASCRAAGLAEHCMAGGQAGGGVSVTPHFTTQGRPARQPRRRPHLHRPGGGTGHNHGRHAAAAVVIYA
jgi:hypothetical protein